MTQEQIAAYQVYFAAKGETYTVEAATGDIEMWEQGKGELKAELVNGSELWRPVVEAYYAALSQPVPESVKLPLTQVPGMSE